MRDIVDMLWYDKFEEVDVLLLHRRQIHFLDKFGCIEVGFCMGCGGGRFLTLRMYAGVVSWGFCLVGRVVCSECRF